MFKLLTVVTTLSPDFLKKIIYLNIAAEVAYFIHFTQSLGICLEANINQNLKGLSIHYTV